MSDWWLGYPAAEATVACRGDTHRLRWEHGELHALDHDDLEGERTLAALGGERYACIDLVEAWRRHADDPRVLTLGSRGATDPLADLSDPPHFPGAGRLGAMPMRGSMSFSFGRSSGTIGRRRSQLRSVSRDDDPDDGPLALLALGGGLPDRLLATVAATWAGRLDEGAAAVPSLEAALFGRVAVALRAWLGEPALEVELRMTPPGGERTLSRDGSALRAELPFVWLAEVWGRGLATVWGRFCLGASSGDGERWTLEAVGPDLGRPSDLILEAPAR